MRSPNNRLDFQKRFDLATWLVREAGSEKWIQEDSPAVARRAAAQLGFHVTEKNVRTSSEIAGVRVMTIASVRALESRTNGHAPTAPAATQTVDLAAIAARVRVDLTPDVRRIINDNLPAVLDTAVARLRQDLAASNQALLESLSEQETKVAQLEQKQVGMAAAVEALKSIRLVN